MTTQQVPFAAAWLALAFAPALALVGCRPDVEPNYLHAPYPQRRVWAVAPLRNESGTLELDGVTLADELARRLDNAEPIDVVPVNRVLAAMEALQMRGVRGARDAAVLRRTLDVDAVVIGTVTAYDPYFPPKIGLAVELFPAPSAGGKEAAPPGPASSVSAFFDAADRRVEQAMRRYAAGRGGPDHPSRSWRRYRISMGLYQQFVSHAVVDRLLEAERRRLRPESPPESVDESPS